jgi:hypothetical protein
VVDTIASSGEIAKTRDFNSRAIFQEFGLTGAFSGVLCLGRFVGKKGLRFEIGRSASSRSFRVMSKRSTKRRHKDVIGRAKKSLYDQFAEVKLLRQAIVETQSKKPANEGHSARK